MKDLEAAKALLTRANAAIVIDEPFFGYLLLRREMRATEDVPAMATDGTEIIYNPAWVVSKTLAEVKAVIIHEILHIAGLHQLRRGARNPNKWNMACDYVINLQVKDAGYTLPEGVLLNNAYANMSAEQVYDLIPDSEAESKGNKWNVGGVTDGQGIAGKSLTDAERTEIESEAVSEIVQAAQATRMRGKLPAHLERLVENLKKSRVPYATILARFMHTIQKNDYSWSRPNKYYLEDDIYLPGLYSEHVGPVVLAIDDSGSCFADQEQFLGELNALLKQAKPEKVYVVGCDATVHTVIEYTPDQLPIKSLKLNGGGGTAFKPVFDWVTEKHLKPACLIYLTDGYGDWNEFPQPNYPVLWGLTTDLKAPWGVQFNV